jgi:hypothetical protein
MVREWVGTEVGRIAMVSSVDGLEVEGRDRK